MRRLLSSVIKDMMHMLCTSQGGKFSLGHALELDPAGVIITLELNKACMSQTKVVTLFIR